MTAIDLPLHRAGQGGEELGGLLEKAHLLAVVAQVVFFSDLLQAVVHLVFTLVQQTEKGVPSKLLDELIRVLGPRHPQDAHLHPGPLQQGDGPLGRRDTGSVPVVGNDGLGEVAGEQLGVLRGQGGAKRGHRAVKARLMEGDGIHIPLRQDDPARLGLFGDVQGEHVAALVVHGGVRGVEVLGCGVVHHPAAEADDLAPDVDDREHDPIPEAVIDPAVLIAHRQTGVQQVPLVIALLSQRLDQGIPPVGGKAQAEAGEGPAGQAAPLQIGQSLRSLRGIQPLVKGAGGLFVDGQQLLPALLGPGGIATVRHLQPGPFGQNSHRVPKGEVVQFHHKVDGPAPLAAAEAFIDLLVGRHREGGGLFTVKGAKAPVISALFRQPD